MWTVIFGVAAPVIAAGVAIVPLLGVDRRLSESLVRDVQIMGALPDGECKEAFEAEFENRAAELTRLRRAPWSLRRIALLVGALSLVLMGFVMLVVDGLKPETDWGVWALQNLGSLALTMVALLGLIAFARRRAARP